MASRPRKVQRFHLWFASRMVRTKLTQRQTWRTLRAERRTRRAPAEAAPPLPPTAPLCTKEMADRVSHAVTSYKLQRRARWSVQEDDTLRHARSQPGWTWTGIASQLPGRSVTAIEQRWRQQRWYTLQRTAPPRLAASGSSSSASAATVHATTAGEAAHAHKRQRITQSVRRPLWGGKRGLSFRCGEEPVRAEARATERRADVSVDRERRRVSRGTLLRVTQEYAEQLEMEIEREIAREIEREIEREVEKQIDTDVETDIEMEHDTGNETEIERGSDTEIEDGYGTEIEMEIERESERESETNIEKEIEKEIETENDTRVVAAPDLVAEPVLIMPARAVAMPLGGAVATTRRAVAEPQPQSVSATNANVGLSAQQQWLLVNTSPPPCPTPLL